MKKILLFLSLRLFDVYAFAKAYIQSYINMTKSYFSTYDRVSSDSIIPVKLEGFITKIYIFEHYAIEVMYPTLVGRLQFLNTQSEQKSIVLLKWLP